MDWLALPLQSHPGLGDSFSLAKTLLGWEPEVKFVDWLQCSAGLMFSGARREDEIVAVLDLGLNER